MRFLLALVGLAALGVVVLMSLGLLTLNTKAGALPTISLSGGKAPAVEANMATMSFGTENKTIEVPTVTTTTKTISVPTINVTKPAEAGDNTITAK